jgi:hypothetical protein
MWQMTEPTHSYLKVPYDVRMAKQIERRMIVDLLLRLRTGFDITNYQYTGMGSIYFVDFILFHRFAGIKRMVSVEYSDDIKKRIEFNRPFNCVKVEYGAIGDYIPKLDRDLQHILWLDYDDRLTHGMLLDVANAATVLSPGSLLLVTADVERPKGADAPSEVRDYFAGRVGGFFDRTWTGRDFSPGRLASTNVEMIKRAVEQGKAGRAEIEFLPLLNFLYKDGHQMLTIGGMLGGKSEKRKISGCDLSDACYVRENFKNAPYEIPNIRVTRKERLLLDSNMPRRRKTWRPRDFELHDDLLEGYEQVYRYLPSFAELLL